MEFLFAPMEGVTYSAFRALHNELFPGAAEYYTPFIAPDGAGSFKPKRLKELTEDAEAGVRVIPQITANRPEPFNITARKLAELGFTEVNLNAGCPSPTVYKKHKGAGMLADLASLEEFLDCAFEAAGKDGRIISVKTRMGVHSTAEFAAIMEIYRKYPFSRLIIHARDRDGLYLSEPDMEGFAAAADGCGFPVSYNGSIFCRDDLDRLLGKAPDIESIMIGRGAIANPALIRALSGGEALKAEELKSFHDALTAAYLSGGLTEHFTLLRMKQLWYYMIHMFPDSRKEHKAILKANTLEDYASAVSALFASGKFEPDSHFIQER